MTSAVILDYVQLGNHVDPTKNAVVQTNKDGSFKVSRGVIGSLIDDMFTFDANGKVAFPKGLAARTDTVSMIRVGTVNGFGSVGNRIPRFSNTISSQGTDITYADSAENGASFTINTSGIYSMALDVNLLNAGNTYGISVNSNQLTSNIHGITAAHRLCCTTQEIADVYGSIAAASVYLATGSVVRPHTNATPVGTSPSFWQFTITRVA